MEEIEARIRELEEKIRRNRERAAQMGEDLGDYPGEGPYPG